MVSALFRLPEKWVSALTRGWVGVVIADGLGLSLQGPKTRGHEEFLRHLYSVIQRDVFRVVPKDAEMRTGCST